MLLERDRELAALTKALARARTGSGAGVSISGESGAGKSALVEAAADGVRGVRILRGSCDPLATPRPLGPFRDLLAQLGSAPVQDSVQRVCEVTFQTLRAEPTALVIEDIHWIDTASAEVLRFLIRRIGAMPCAVVITHRDDEVGAQHAARPLLGDLAGHPDVVTLRLPPLSIDAVASMLGGASLSPELVHEVTGGNPFFVAEVAKEPDLPLPLTVRDAVLARLAGIAPGDLEVLQLAAVAPDRVDDRLLPALGVDYPTLLRLHDTGLLRRDRHGLVFRHELSRLALESTIPLGGMPRLHGRLLEALERIEPREPAVLTHHAVAAGDPVRAVRYAQEAADEAVRAGSHTEAAAFIRIALDHLPGGGTAERARLQLQLGIESYMTSHLDLAITSIEESFPLWRRLGDLNGLSAAYDSCAIFEYYNADRQQAEMHADRAVEVAMDPADAAYGMARVTRGFLAYLRSQHEVAEHYSDDGLRVARETGNEPLALRGSLVRAVSDLALGVDGARQRCLSVIEQARDVQLDELASTGYSQVSYLDVEQGRLAASERVLEVSLPFTVDRDIPVCTYWQTAVRSRLRFREGRWSAALEDADDALAAGGMPLARFWPLVVRGLVSLRSGGLGERLEEAWLMASRLDEPLRVVPALAALAEQQWLTGTVDGRVVTAAEHVQGWRSIPALGWALGDLSVWLWRLGIESSIPVTSIAEPYRLTLTGHHREATAHWRQAGTPYEAALSAADSGDLDGRLWAIERLDLLGAVASADRYRRMLRQEGVAQVPVRPRASTRANPSGLTNRQLEVAKLVARGFTNAEIAERLFISLRTTDHHVSAVLTKLGMSNRRSVVVQAAELGLS